MFDKNYFLNQLRNGVSMDSMGQALADAMNEAQEAYTAELAVKEKEAEAAAMAQTKRDMALDLIDIIRDYGRMVAPEAADILDNVDEDDIDAMIVTLDQMFQMMSAMAQLKINLEKAQADAEMAQAKRDMALDLIDIIRDYGHLVAPEAADILDDVNDDDVDAMIVTLDQMFQMMSSMAQLKANLESLDKLPVPKAQAKSHITPVAKPSKSDDEVLAKFIASLM